MGGVVPVAIPYGQPLPKGNLILSAQDVRVMEISNDWHEGTRLRLEVSGDAVQVVLEGVTGKSQEYVSPNEEKLQEQIEGLLQKQAELERKNRALEEEILDYQGEVTAKQEQLTDSNGKLAAAKSDLAVAKNFENLIMELPIQEVKDILDRAQKRREDKYSFDHYGFGGRRNYNEPWHVDYVANPGPKTQAAYEKIMKQKALDYFSLDGETL